MELVKQIQEAIEEKIAGTDMFVVDIKISPARIAVFMDHHNGVKLEDCIEINRYLESKPELAGIFESHDLEVSSAGMDEPMKVLKQYQNRVGKEIAVLLKNGVRINGVLKSVTEDEMTLVERKQSRVNGKNILEVLEHAVPFEQVKEAKRLYNFNKVLRD